MTAAELAGVSNASRPAAAESNPCRVRYFCWQTMRSEAFLFSLQFCSMILGVWKDTGDFETDAPELHAAYSALEIGAALLLIGVRTASLRRKLGRLDDRFRLLAPSTPDIRLTPKYRVLTRWVALHTLLGVILFVANVTSFALFWYMRRTDWIVLTNNSTQMTIVVDHAVMTTMFCRTTRVK